LRDFTVLKRRNFDRLLLRVYPALQDRAIFGSDPWQSYCVVHSNRNRCLGGKINLFPFPRQDVRGATDQPYTETARHVTENGPGQSAAAGSNRSGEHVTLDVVLGLNYLAFFDLDVLPGLSNLVSG